MAADRDAWQMNLRCSVKNIREALNKVNYCVCDELLSVHGVTGRKIKSTHAEILKKEILGKDLQL